MTNFGGEWREPDWNDVGRVHDWRNYISERVRELWFEIPDVVKEALFEQANENALYEDWE